MTNAPLQREKPRYPRKDAIEVARQMCTALTPCCGKLIVAGSLRRRKLDVGDVEILYVPNIIDVPDPGDMFGKKVKANAVDLALQKLIEQGSIEKRTGPRGGTSWGELNKFAVHVASGIPVDFFAATHDNWWSLVVSRTGPAESNIRICQAARDHGWEWDPYMGFKRPSQLRGGGFVDVMQCRTEAHVFEFVGLEFLPPEERR